MSHPRLDDTWWSREYPVLVEAARAIDAGSQPDHAAVAAVTGLDEPVVGRAIAALTRAGYLADLPQLSIDGKPAGWGGTWTELTERGRRAVGLWPSGEDVDDLVDALRRAEDQTSDPEQRSRLRQAAAGLLGVPKDIMVDVLAAYIARQTGIG